MESGVAPEISPFADLFDSAGPRSSPLFVDRARFGRRHDLPPASDRSSSAYFPARDSVGSRVASPSPVVSANAPDGSFPRLPGESLDMNLSARLLRRCFRLRFVCVRISSLPGESADDDVTYRWILVLESLAKSLSGGL
ncbi:hypothetical protein NL676_033672 [Syzygium grande]|nr:hypothetical protein NL676_033672 [Syzygium grande]